MDISLIHGAVPWVVKVLAVTALGTAVVLARRGWGPVVVRQATLAAVVMAAIAAGVALTGVVPYHFPTSFYVWFGVVAFSVLLARAGWARATAGRRLASIAAVVCTAVLAATLINAHYAYRPTLASIFGAVSRDERSPTRPGRLADESSRGVAQGSCPRRQIAGEIGERSEEVGMTQCQHDGARPSLGEADDRPAGRIR